MKRTQDEIEIQEAYIRMCDGMIAKDEKILRDVLDDSFVLIHLLDESNRWDALCL